ncbi:MAG: penicillin-binding protein 2 [Pseudomonadota bacterium]
MSGDRKSGRSSLRDAAETPPEIDEMLGGRAKEAAKPRPSLFRKKPRKAQSGAERKSGGAPARKPLSQARFAVIGIVFVSVMGASLLRFADMAAERRDDVEPAYATGLVDAEKAADLAEKLAEASEDGAPEPRRPLRAPIIDRNGAALARDVVTYDLYLDREAFAFPEDLSEAAEMVAAAFPGRLGEADVKAKLKATRSPLLAWSLTAREAQRAHDLGVPGLYLTPSYDRYYPVGAAAAHVLGHVDFGGVGRSGVEGALDARLKADPETPLQLTLDMRMQRATRSALLDAMARTEAIAAAGVVMSAATGEVLALVSLPDFDPHHRPPSPTTAAEQESSPLFHRAAIGLYELGSIVKTVTWALALETGAATMADAFPPMPPLTFGDHTIEADKRNEGVSFPMAFARSSNRIAAELALLSGRPAQRRLFERLGLSEALPLELGKARLSAPPRSRERWRDVDTAVAGFGYRVEMTPVHIAAAVASLSNGGERVRPTLLRRAPEEALGPRERVVSAETSRRLRELLRLTVTDGTGRRADAPGLRVGGKTGTADKAVRGGYDETRAVASFVAAFPIERPELIVMVMLDEPKVEVDGEIRGWASLTAAPAARDVITAVAPLAGVATAPDPALQAAAPEAW